MEKKKRIISKPIKYSHLWYQMEVIASPKLSYKKVSLLLLLETITRDSLPIALKLL